MAWEGLVADTWWKNERLSRKLKHDVSSSKGEKTQNNHYEDIKHGNWLPTEIVKSPFLGAVKSKN